MYFPGSQDAGSGVLLPSGQRVPLGQTLQRTAPFLAEYFPSSQELQRPLPVPSAKLPALQLTGEEDPATAKLPGGLNEQSDESARPVLSE